ncbi:MAG TPA: hypothetical protein VM264_08315 [Acidimicrobiales bacterium]|nr:hypothetical protein [Acidimicrobiales bacterium]
MPLLRGHARPDPAGWRQLQGMVRDLPREVVWPEDVCHRCKAQGQMYFGSGKAQCAECEARTVVQVAPPVGLHERRAVIELNA